MTVTYEVTKLTLTLILMQIFYDYYGICIGIMLLNTVSTGHFVNLLQYKHDYITTVNNRNMMQQSNVSTIPHIGHFMWIGSDTSNMPSHFRSTIKRWKLQYPNWQFILWNNETSRNLVVDYYPLFLELYDSFPKDKWISRADMIRYLVIHKFGGLYIDLDIQPRSARNIETELLNGHMLDLMFVVTPNIGITNALYAAIADHSFFLDLVDDIRQIHEENKQFSIVRHFIPSYLYDLTVIGTDRLWIRYTTYNWSSNQNIKLLSTINYGKTVICADRGCDYKTSDDSFFIHVQGGSWKDVTATVIDFVFVCHPILCGYMIYFLWLLFTKQLFLKWKLHLTIALILLLCGRMVWFLFIQPFCIN